MSQERIDCHGNFEGGYFVQSSNSHIATFESGSGFFVTCQSHRGLLNQLVEKISEAKKYVKICSFIIDNKQIYNCLIEQIKKRNLSVFILTAVNEQNIQSNMISEDEKMSVNTSRHFEYISELVNVGAHVRASTNAHAKFLICDGESGLLMSANLTEPSLNSNENGNPPNDESGVEIIKKQVLLQLEKIFDSIFLYGTEFKKFITLNAKNQLIDHKETDILLEDLPILNDDLLLSFEEMHQGIYGEILEQLKKAKRDILIATYSIVGLENLSEMLEAIKVFIARGGKVRMFCRAMNHRGDHLKACSALTQLGVEIFADMFNHAKGLLRDDEEGIIFTANIDGKHGLKSGFEVGMRITGNHISFGKFKQFLNFQIDSAPYVFKLCPEKKELTDFYRHWYQRKRTVPQAIVDNIEIKYRQNAQIANTFVNYVKKFPVFYAAMIHGERKQIILEISDKQFKIEEMNSNTFELKNELRYTDFHKGAKYLFEYQTISLTAYA